MLEKWYWIAGIVVAVVSVVGLFFKIHGSNTISNNQTIKVSGRHNLVNHKTSISAQGEAKDE